MTMLEQDIMDAVGEAYRAMADQAERRGFKVRWISMPYGKIPYWPVATIPTDQFAAHSIRPTIWWLARLWWAGRAASDVRRRPSR